MESTEGQNSVNSFPLIATRGQAYGRSSVDVETLSLSSEEGVYTLSALDSEEEEAYQYILALDEETSEALQFQPATTSDDLYPALHVCQCREDMGSKTKIVCNSGFQQMAPVMLWELAVDENQQANTDHNGFVSVPPVNEICGQKVSSKLITASENNSQTERDGCTQEDRHTAGGTPNKREYEAYRVEGNGVRERSSARLESHDLNVDPHNAKDLCNDEVTNGKDIDREDQHSQWVESKQMDSNCTLSQNTDKDIDSEQTSQTAVEFSLQEEVEVMEEKDMFDIDGANGRPLNRESSMDHSTGGKEDVVEWDNKHTLLSSQDITEEDADPTR